MKEDCEPTWSNVPTHGPLTAEHIRKFRDDVMALAGKPTPVEDVVVLPGWVDEDGRFTEKYWADFASLNSRG